MLKQLIIYVWNELVVSVEVLGNECLLQITICSLLAISANRPKSQWAWRLNNLLIPKADSQTGVEAYWQGNIKKRAIPYCIWISVSRAAKLIPFNYREWNILFMPSLSPVILYSLSIRWWEWFPVNIIAFHILHYYLLKFHTSCAGWPCGAIVTSSVGLRVGLGLGTKYH